MKRPTFQALLFDFDYTLADSSLGAVDCINFALKEMGLNGVSAEAACRENGRLRIEGKDYIVKDGDVMHFRFNV